MAHVALNYFLTRCISCLCFCSLCISTCLAQPDDYLSAQKATPSLRLITPKGFPEQELRSMAQDDAGFMWIATNGGGLVRYDGKNIRLFTHTDGDSSTLTSNLIWMMYKDGKNRLWLIYHTGAFDLFDPVTEKVRHLSTELHFFQKAAAILKVPNPEPIGVFNTVFEDSKHRVWLSCWNLPVRIDASGNGSMAFIPKNAVEANALTTFNEIPGGHLLVSTYNAIRELDEQFRLIRQTPQPANRFKAGVADSMPGYSLLKNDTLYVGGTAGVTVYNIHTGQISFRGGLPKTAIRAEQVTSPQNNQFLFYDTASSHLYRYTTGDAGFTDLGKYEYFTRPNSPSGYLRLTYYYDKWGGLWHIYKNLFYSAVAKTPFVVIHNTGNYLERITKYFYYSLREAGKWNETDTHYPWVSSPSGATYVIDSAYKLRLVAQALGTNNNHIGNGRKWQVLYTGGNYPLRSDNTYDAYGRLWVVNTDKQELFTIDTMGQVRICPQKLNIWGDINIKATGDGNCWVIYLHKGLKLYNLEKGLVKEITKKTGPNHLPETSLYEMVRDGLDSNNIWITTLSSGMVRFHEKEETLQIYTMQDGWPSNTILTPWVDEKGFLWYQTSNGIYRYDTKNNRHLLVVDSAYYKGATWGNSSIVALGKTHLWFSNTNESAIINAAAMAVARQVSTVLTAIKINNRSIRDGDTLLVPAPLNTLPELRLAYNENFLSLQFAALAYARPGQARYRYQLQGIDKEWINNEGDDVAQYTSLPPGSYTFKVNATNEDGNWSSEVKSIRIIISPPWWRTGWMYAVYALLLAGAVYLFIKTRLRRLQLRQQVVLKQKEAEQAQALEETKSRFFANITHELRTPLTLILSPVQKQLQEGVSTHTPLLQGVYHNSQTLLRLINQLLDMSKLEGGNMPLTLHQGDVIQFIESLLPPFQQQAAIRNIRFLISLNDHREEAHLFDSDKLEKVLHNLLSNAFKFTPDGGQVSCQLSVGQLSAEQNTSIHNPRFQPGENGEIPTDFALTGQPHTSVGQRPMKTTTDGWNVFEIRVSDTGIGIPPEQLPHIFTRFYQVNASTTRKYEGTGIGLSLVQEFTELMGGTITAESTPGSGSVFTLMLPLAIATGSAAPVIHLPKNTAITLAQPTIDDTILPADEPDKPLVLVTDDNEQLRQFIRDSLSFHYRVITAVNGADGLQKAIAELPELVISDVMMPVMDGYEFCQKVKENPLTSHIGFILLTAKTADESRVSGLRLGADHYIGKPFIVEELLLVAANSLKRQQQLRNLYSNQLQQPAEKLPPVKEVEDPFLQSVYSVIETHLDSDRLDVDFLASEMAVSRRTLNRKLATVADTSANELIRNYRLKKAAELLLHGEAVSSAAYATGFSTPSYFSQCFKEMYGITPVQWAENGGMSQN